MLVAMRTEGASPEAEIVVNGVKLTPAQSMAVRVACARYQGEMSGLPAHMSAVLDLMMR